MIRRVIARQAAGATPCTGTATGNAITTGVGNAAKGGVPWEFQVPKQTVTTPSRQAATLPALDEVSLNATNVNLTDSAGKKRTWPNYPFIAFYTPTLKFNMPAGGGNVNAKGNGGPVNT